MKLILVKAKMSASKRTYDLWSYLPVCVGRVSFLIVITYGFVP